MTSPPQAILAPLSASALFLVATVDPGGEERVRELSAELPALVRSIGFRDPGAGLSAVIGFGADVWPRLFAAAPPAGLHPFTPIAGTRHDAPATPGDLLLHLRAARPDLVFELATRILDALQGAVTPVSEVQGFRFFDSRNLLGFVDGSENPTGADAQAAVLIGDGRFAGGSFVVVQKYLHDLAGWNALSAEDQERIIGREKLSNVELADKATPSSAHRVLTSITDAGGEEIQILRANMPFGSPGHGEFGTFFIGYASSPAPIETMLRNMFVGDPPGNYDHLLDYSTAVTGGLFFVPSAGLIEELAGSAPA